MTKSIVTALFGKSAKAKVIQWLYVQNKETISAPALARSAGVATGSIHKTLTELVSDQLVVREISAAGPVYRAPTEDPRLNGLFILLRQDSDLVADLSKVLAKHKSVVYACIFGSFAAGTTHKASDIDVLILCEGELKRLSLLGDIGKVASKFNREINPEIYTVTEYQALMENGNTFILNVIGNSFINLKGIPPWQS